MMSFSVLGAVKNLPLIFHGIYFTENLFLHIEVTHPAFLKINSIRGVTSCQDITSIQNPFFVYVFWIISIVSKNNFTRFVKNIKSGCCGQSKRAVGQFSCIRRIIKVCSKGAAVRNEKILQSKIACIQQLKTTAADYTQTVVINSFLVGNFT